MTDTNRRGTPAAGGSRQVLPPPRRTGWRRWLPTPKTWLFTFLGLLALFGGLAAAAWESTAIPASDPLASAQSSVLYYDNGTREMAQIGAHDSIHVSLAQVSPAAKAAVLAAEDRNFYHEPGISFRGMARAVWVDLRGGDLQGGSTITQQLAKNLYLTQQRTVTRKLREILLAMKLDQQRSKDSILQDYLNIIYLGHGTYGIEAASRYYFGVHAAKLTPAQAAVIAATINSPGYFDPLDPSAHQRAVDRWHYVVAGMVKDGALTQAQADALKYPTDIRAHKPPSVSGPNGFIVASVRDELRRNGFSDEQIDIEGLRVYTTINYKAQVAAVAAERKQFLPLVPGKSKNPPVSALVSVRPGDGAIEAMYGGDDYGAGGCSTGISCFNLATQALAQPGSSFKPYVLAQALTEKIGIRTKMYAPYTVDVRGKAIHNDSPSETGTYTLASALAQSINTIYVPLAQQVGPKNVADMAHALGVPASVPLHAGNDVTPLIALGVYDVHPIDQAVAYATLAAGGIEADPYLVTKVTDREGHTLYESSHKHHRVISADVAADVDYAMQQVVTNGTGTAAQLDGGRPAAGKTGTTESNSNAWFVGFTGPGSNQLATAVWIGHAKATAPLTDLNGYRGGVYGGQLPAQIWKAYTDSALSGTAVHQFPPPAYVGSSQPTFTPSVTSPAPSSSSPTPSITPSVVSPSAGAPSGSLTPTPSNPVPSVTGTPTPPPTGTPTGGGGTSPPGHGGPTTGAAGTPATPARTP